MSGFWDERYSEKEYVFGKKPNVFFEEQVKILHPGKLLVPGAGEGRDAVYAASIGWKVNAFDLSFEGKQKCALLAREFGTSVNYEILNAADFKPNTEEYEAVALIYFHLPVNIRKTFHQQVIKSLKKGGTVILEAFNPKQLQNSSGGPKDISMLITPSIINDDFAGLRIEKNEELQVVLHEGKYHEGKADIIRFVGKKA